MIVVKTTYSYRVILENVVDRDVGTFQMIQMPSTHYKETSSYNLELQV